MHRAVARAHDLRDAWIEHAMRISEDGYAHDQKWASSIVPSRDMGLGIQAAIATRGGSLGSKRTGSLASWWIIYWS
jgi:hypothetical protein